MSLATLPSWLRADSSRPARVAAVAAIVATGAAACDARLGGGLARAALHEVYGGPDDGGAAAAFALLVALRAGGGKPLLWVGEDRGERRDGRLYPPGLGEIGVDPDRIVLTIAPDTIALLRAAADIVRCPAVGALVLAPQSAARLDLTASRRLAFAAAASGVTTLIVRTGEPVPSAAQTRWRVTSAPSRRLAANAPGSPVFDVSLLRHRGGIAGFDARMEWDRDRRAFADPPRSSGAFSDASRADGTFTNAALSRGVAAAAAGRAAEPQRWRAA